MVILQQPSVLSYSGNLSDIILTDNAPVSLKLFKGVTLILEEIYAPDSSGEINIRLKEVIDGLLSVHVPTADVYLQASAFADFTVTLNNVQNIIFRVIKGGVDAEIIDVDLFTKSNFLTWQPQQKVVKFHDPEWLTYYSKNASVLKAKAYYAETTETITLAALPDGALTSVNVNYGHLISFFTSQPLYVDIWVELADVRTSFIQRYILSIEEFEFEDIFVFENSLGGVDSIRMTGEKSTVENFKFESALFDETTLDYSVVPEQVFEKNTGFFRSERERAWSIEFFKSLQKYYNHNGSLKSILISKPGLDSVEGELVDYKFNFGYSRQTKFLNLARPDVVPPVLEVVGPNEELFFLAPNLNLLPTADFDDSWLIPLQPAFDSSWYKLSIGSLVNYMQNNVLVAVSGGVLADYYNKATINSFFAGATPISGYNKSNWDTAYTWGNHALAGYALAANHYDKTTSDTRFIRNQNVLQAGAELNIAGGRFNNYLVIPTTAPTVPTPGAIWISAGGTSGGGPGGGGAQFLYELVDVAITTPVAGQSLVWNGVNWINQNATVDAWTKIESDSRYLGIGATAVAAGTAPWSGISGKPTSLSQFTNDLGNYGGWITGINSDMVTTALGYTPYNPANYPVNAGGETLQSVTERGNTTNNFIRVSGNNKYTGPAAVELNYDPSLDIGYVGAYDRNLSVFKPLSFFASSYNFTNGYVGIGTDNPQHRLQVSGNIFASTGNGGGFKLEGGSSITREGGVDLTITTRNLGINTTTPTATLDVNGTGHFSGTVTAPTFAGTLNGNANTADYATNATTATNWAGSGALNNYLPLTGGTLIGALNAPSLSDGYINYSSAQINRSSGFVELQYTGTGGVQVFGGTPTPIIFNPGGSVTAPKIQATEISIIPLGAPTVPTPGAIWISAGGTSGGGPGGGGAQFLYELVDVAITTPVAGQSLVWNGVNWINQNATVDAWTKVESDSRYLGIGATAVNANNWGGFPFSGGVGSDAGIDFIYGLNSTNGNAYALNKTAAKSFFGISDGSTLNNNISGSAPWSGITGKPTALSQFTNDLGNYGGWITGINSGMVTTALGYIPVNPSLLGSNAFNSTAYLPLTGGTVTGNVTASGFTTPGYLTANILRVLGTSSSIWDLETSGNTLTFNHFNGGSWNQGFSIARDGNVTAPTFTGALNGNANTATNAELALKFNSSSHAGTFWLVNNWDGTYWNITSNHGSPARVGYADNAGTATNWAGSGALNNYLPLTGGTLIGALNAPSLSDGYINYSLAQINRSSGFVELQYTGTGGVQVFGGTPTPIIFNPGGSVTAPKIQATETLIIPLGAPAVPTAGAIWIQTAP